MATKYIQKADVKLLLDISGTTQDNLIDALIIGAESIFDNLIDEPDGLISSEKTEDFAVNDPNQPWDKKNRVFSLGHIKPTELTTINGEDIGTIEVDYTITGQTLELKEPVDQPLTFPYRFRVVYTSGYASNAVPQDVQQAIKFIVSALYSTRKAAGVASFKQDLLSINYKDTNLLDEIMDPAVKSIVRNIAAKYTVHNTIIG